jgi:hypothetical protein
MKTVRAVFPRVIEAAGLAALFAFAFSSLPVAVRIVGAVVGAVVAAGAAWFLFKRERDLRHEMALAVWAVRDDARDDVKKLRDQTYVDPMVLQMMLNVKS